MDGWSPFQKLSVSTLSKTISIRNATDVPTIIIGFLTTIYNEIAIDLRLFIKYTVGPDLIATEILAFPSKSSRNKNDSDLMIVIL